MSKDIFFAKGKRSEVYITSYNNIKAVKKVINPRFSTNLKNEAYWLLTLNKHHIGPKLFHVGKDFIVMEFIDGSRIIQYFESANKKSILNVIKSVILQCHKLDELMVDKKELTNPYKHIIVRHNKPIMIDFERCKSTQTPKNITQFLQFLSSRRVYCILKNKGITLEPNKLRSNAKLYKKSHDLHKILALLH